MNRDNVRQLLVIVALLAMIAINALSTALPLNGQTPAEISDRAKVFFVPAGYVFSIWGLIYLGTLAYAIYQALPSNAENRELAGIGTLLCSQAWPISPGYSCGIMSTSPYRCR